MDKQCLIDCLADELLNLILFFLVVGSEEVSDGRISRRGLILSAIKRNGSEANFPRGEKSDLDRYRLVCKRFMRIATPRKFRHFTLRFSRDGFKRLNELVDMQLACHTRHFTYMVRPFYLGRDWENFLADVSLDHHSLSEIHRLRLADQKFLVENANDLAALKRAMSFFSSLQQVKLLRLQDQADEEILKLARRGNPERDLHLDWDPACSHAVQSLGVALLGSTCHSVRFLGPQLSPKAAVRLLHTPELVMSSLGERLTCLDVNFQSAHDVTSMMIGLSGVFRNFLLAARNLVTISVGFSADLPVSIPLEDIFNHLHWPRLRCLGIQGWKLDSAEIIAIVRRHGSRLRELRIPYVYLREGSRWRDILSVLHNEIEHLESVDLQHIDYAFHFDSEVIHGVEIPPLTSTEEEDNGLYEDERSEDTDSSYVVSAHHSQSETSDSETHQWPTQALSIGELSLLTANDLGDNGMYVKREHWGLWEKWVVSRLYV
ncbi:F-box domain protein [Talaromyces proteolyticus]|uniref:F-box domain protein n=1 Tax=Talaromyces proteolyticus TaxID=1131652 RepID=A0AAD4KSM7_9EURO|nr:F-box domain protein [Talaromyces proteolyticus]KAH8700183.1 F-box domain protein [Talaromyces proteolyticus]